MIFLKRAKHKPDTYSIREWCNHIKMKTTTMKELNVLVPEYKCFHADRDMNWARWKKFKIDYNIFHGSMRSLLKEHASFLKQKGNKENQDGFLGGVAVHQGF